MNSPFDWRGPSTIAQDDKEMRAQKDGKTRSIRQTEIHLKAAREGKPITALNNRRLERRKP